MQVPCHEPLPAHVPRPAHDGPLRVPCLPPQAASRRGVQPRAQSRLCRPSKPRVLRASSGTGRVCTSLHTLRTPLHIPTAPVLRPFSATLLDPRRLPYRTPTTTTTRTQGDVASYTPNDRRSRRPGQQAVRSAVRQGRVTTKRQGSAPACTLTPLPSTLSIPGYLRGYPFGSRGWHMSAGGGP